MLQSASSKIKLLLSIALIFLMGIGVFSSRQSYLVSEASFERKKTTEFISQIEKLRTLLTEVETGQRGFLLTEKKEYLAPYEEAVREIPIQIQLIESQAKGLGKYEKEVLSIKMAIDEKLAELEETIRLYHVNGLKNSLRLVRTDIGRNKMDLAKSQMNQLIVSLSKEREAQYRHFEEGLNQISTSILLGSILGVNFFILAIVFLMGANRKQKQAESEMKKFSHLVQNSSDLIAISNTERKLIYINPAGRKLLGISSEQPMEEIEAARFYTPEDNERMKNEVIPEARKRGNWSGEFRFRNILTNEIIPFSTNFFPMYDSQTHQVLGTATVSRDLRENKKLKKELDRFFEVSLDMLAIADTKGYFRRINPAFSEILGYTEEEFCSRPCTDFIHPDDIQATLEQIQAQADGRAVLSFENRYRTKNGDYRWFSWKSFPDGELTYGAARDITELKKQQEIMKKLSIDAVASSQAKSEFLANMSHEIRTPLNGVIGMTTLLLESKLSAEQQDYGLNIRNSAESLLTIINDILDFSKIEAGKLDIEKVSFDLGKLVEETAKGLQWATKNKSLSLNVSVDRPAQNYFLGDSGRIRQILTNLVHNAIKFTDRGSITINCRLQSSFYTHSSFQFEVIDTGIGLAPETQTQLFQSFYQADASTTRKYGGTGLGLSICRRLVELMNGQIGVESTLGQGSKFWFTLPLEKTVEHKKTESGSRELKVSGFAGSRILIAEDNTVNQKILISILEKMKLKTQAVSNGLEVLALLKEQDFDLVLMDCHMPELDGYDATKRIRESSTVRDRQIPIVAMTANALKDDRDRCLEVGMDDYTTKPVKVDELYAILEKWLEKQSLRKKSAS